MVRVLFLISGGGSTMAVVLRAINDGVLRGVEAAAVVASRECAGLELARTLGLKQAQVSIVRPKAFPDQLSFGRAILRVAEAHGASLLSQNGWLAHTPTNVVAAFAGRSLNQHPGALDPGRPDFGGPGMYGRRVHAATLFYRRLCGEARMWTEATVHRVADEYDRGEVLGRLQLPIEPADTAETLAARLLPFEHQLVVHTMQQFADGVVEELPPRPEPLVHPTLGEVLACCKHFAKLAYPKG